MSTIAKLYEDDFEIQEDYYLDEELPIITDGLVAHYSLGDDRRNEGEPIEWDYDYRILVEIDGSKLTNIDPNNTWSSSSISKQRFSGGCFVEWEMEYVEATKTTKGAEMMGLADANTTVSYTGIEYAIYTHENGNVQVYENGSSKGVLSSWSPNTKNIFRVEYDGINTVRYYHNGTLMRSITKTHDTNELFAKCSLHSHGARNSIKNGKMGEYIAPPYITHSNVSHFEGATVVENPRDNIITWECDPNKLSVGGTMGYSNQLGTGNYFGIVDGKGYGGGKALKAVRGSDDFGRFFRTISGTAGNKYSYSALVYSESPTYIRFEAYGGDYSWGIDQTASDHTGSGWEVITTTINSVLSSNTTLYMFIYPNINGSPIYVDWFHLQQGDQPSFYGGSNDAIGEGLLNLRNPLTTGDFTMNFWVNIRSLPDIARSHTAIFCMGSYPNEGSVTIMDTSSSSQLGTYRMIRKGSNEEWHWMTGDILTPNSEDHNYFYKKWQMITVIKAGSNYKIYTNGILIGSIAHSLTGSSPANIWLGRNSANNSRSGSAWFKDFSIYNRELDASDISKLYKSNWHLCPDKIISKNNEDNGTNMVDYNKLDDLCINQSTSHPYYHNANSLCTIHTDLWSGEKFYRNAGAAVRLGHYDGRDVFGLTQGNRYRLTVTVREAAGFKRSETIQIDYNDVAPVAFNLTYDWQTISIEGNFNGNANYDFIDLNVGSGEYFEFKDLRLELVDDSIKPMKQYDDKTTYNNITEKEEYRMEGDWIMVFDGLASEGMYNYSTNRVYELETGHQIPFTKMKVRCKFWDYEEVEELTATAYYNKSWYQHNYWIDTQSDGISPQMKFNATAGGDDADRTIGFKNTNKILWGYGNTWRRIIPPLYVYNVNYLYLGNAVSTYVHTLETDFGYNSGDHYMDGNPVGALPRDNSGTYRSTKPGSDRALTPLEFQSIQVFIK